jgi:hypothetical protein
MADQWEWRGYVNQILYGTDLRKNMEEADVERLADALIEQRYFTQPVVDYRNAVAAGLSSGTPLAFDDDQNESAVQNLLSRLLIVLDSRRPWPEPWFYSLDREVWPSFRDAPVIGQIPLLKRELRDILHRPFLRDPETPSDFLIVLKLRTGRIIAFRSQSPSTEPGIDVLAVDDAAQTLSDFRELSGMDVTPPSM